MQQLPYFLPWTQATPLNIDNNLFQSFLGHIRKHRIPQKFLEGLTEKGICQKFYKATPEVLFV